MPNALLRPSHRLTCEEARTWIWWWIDDELDADASVEVEEHIGQCARYRHDMAREENFRSTLRRAVRDVKAPAALRRRVLESIHRRARPRSRWMQTLAIAALLLAGIFVATMTKSADERNEWVHRHNRELPMDVVATDLSRVQGFLKSRLPFSVRLPELSSFRASVVGGRLVQINQQDAAHVRYTTPLGRLSVFIQEASARSVLWLPNHLSTRSIQTEHLRGYGTAQWQADGLLYSLVSDFPGMDTDALLSSAAR